MENSSVQRGQDSSPSWGPPPKRAAGGRKTSEPAPSAATRTANSVRTEAAMSDQAEPPSSGQHHTAAVTLQPPQHEQPKRAGSVPPPPRPFPPPNPWQYPGSEGSPKQRRQNGRSRLATVGSAPAWVIAATIAASVLLELALRTRLSSVATLLAAFVMAALVFSSASRRRPLVLLALTVAVLGAAVAVLRASIWVTFPSLLMAGSCLVLASQGRLLAGGLTAAAANYLRDIVLSPRWLLQPLQTRRVGTFSSLGRSLILAAVAVAPLAMLLASADAVFSQLLTSASPGKSWEHAMLTVLILPFVTAVAIAARRTDNTAARHPDNTAARRPDNTAARRPVSGRALISMTETTVVLGSVGLLLAIWGATQIVVALGGADRLLATADLTAAENARQGFFQLVAATAFLIGIIVAVDRFSERTSPSDHRIFLGLTVLIAAETLGVVVATYSRLALYISGFGNTMLRASVAWFLAWLAVVMLVLVVSVNRRTTRPWFATSMFGLAALWVLAFGLWNPEAAVARGNLERGEQAADIDYRYLGRKLGPDAIPTLVTLAPTLEPEQQEQLIEDLCRQADDLGGGYSVLSWNRSHAEAAEALASLGC